MARLLAFGRDHAQSMALLPTRRDAGEKPGSCAPPLKAGWATRLSARFRRCLQCPHLHRQSTAAEYVRNRIAGIHKIKMARTSSH
jgi:hypothetical protein